MLSRYSVKKPMTVLVAVILVIMLGVISFTRLSTDLLPSMDLPYVIVMTTYPGANPEKVEETVTKPIEQSLSTVSGLENITSTSSENSSTVILEFGFDTNMDSAIIEVNSMVDMIEGSLEEGVMAPMIIKMNPDMMPIMILGADYEGLDSKDATKDLEENIIPAIERVDGVGAVTAMGLVEEQLHITLDNNKIDQINEDFLASIDSELTVAAAAISQGEQQLKALQEEIAEKSDEGNAQMTYGQKQIVSAIAQIETGITSLESAKTQLEIQKSDLATQKELLEAVYESGGSVDTDLKAQIDALTAGIAGLQTQIDALQTEINSFSTQKTELEESLIDTSAGQTSMNLEIIQAQTEIAIQQANLETQKAEFETQKEEALASVDMGEMLSAEMISGILAAQNFSMPAGYIQDGDEEFSLKIGEAFTTEEEIRNLVIMDTPETGKIYLHQVAEVSLEDKKEDLYAKINGNDAIILSIQKQGTASTADVSKAVNEEIESLMSANPSLSLTSLMDQGIYIDIVIDSVLNNLILGGIFAIFVLFLFLRNIRPTLVVSFSIPISIMFAIVLMYFSGVDINIISLAGLALGVGMLVDNSIVVIENIFRLRSQGVEVKRAAVQGAKEVAGAITASTLTTVCVFSPILFTDGLSRQLFVDMGLTIAYSLLASLVVALTLVPSLSSTLLSKEMKKPGKIFNKSIDIYTNLLTKALRRKVVILISALLLLVASGVIATQTGLSFIPESDSTEMTATISVPPETTTEESRDITDQIVSDIETIEDVKTVAAMEGSSMGMGGGSTSLYILLNEDKNKTSQEVAVEIANLTKDYPATIEVSGSSMDMSAMTGSGIVVKLEGADLDTLIQLSKDVKSELSEIEGVTEVSNGMEDAAKEKRIIVDKDEAAKYSLTVAQVYQEITEALSMETESTIATLDSENTSIIVINDQEDEVTYDELLEYTFTTTAVDGGEGKEVKLDDIVTFEEGETLSSINHENMGRVLNVTASVEDGYNIALVSRDVETALEGFPLPDGYELSFDGENESIMETMSDLVLMILAAMVFVYLIMVAQFQSLLSPFIVMFTMPLAFTGGFLALTITRQDLSVISMLGFVMLAGIVVNNAIVFVDYTNQLRGAGMEKQEALVTAGSRRLRPIVMTAMTTVLGLSTLALGVGQGADMIQPMAIVVIGGLIYSTILTLFIVPIMYDIFYRKEFKIISDAELDAQIDGKTLVSEAELDNEEHKYHDKVEEVLHKKIDEKVLGQAEADKRE